jgi:hypothetical protein
MVDAEECLQCENLILPGTVGALGDTQGQQHNNVGSAAARLSKLLKVSKRNPSPEPRRRPMRPICGTLSLSIILLYSFYVGESKGAESYSSYPAGVPWEQRHPPAPGKAVTAASKTPNQPPGSGDIGFLWAQCVGAGVSREQQILSCTTICSGGAKHPERSNIAELSLLSSSYRLQFQEPI